MAFLGWLALVVVEWCPSAPTANDTKLTRMLVRHVNDWQQAYGPGYRWLAVENELAFMA
jgi:hypothetical protein